MTNRPKRPCPKCNSTRFGLWTSSSGKGEHWYCRVCQAERRRRYRRRMKDNGGSHTNAEWLALLARTPICAGCRRSWSDIPLRANRRYKNPWTKDHVIPVLHGGSDNISNIQPLCYQCNFAKAARIGK